MAKKKTAKKSARKTAKRSRPAAPDVNQRAKGMIDLIATRTSGTK